MEQVHQLQEKENDVAWIPAIFSKARIFSFMVTSFITNHINIMQIRFISTRLYKIGGEDFPKFVWASNCIKSLTPIVFYVKSHTDRLVMSMLKSRIITFNPQIDRFQLLVPILLLLYVCTSGYAESIMWPPLNDVTVRDDDECGEVIIPNSHGKVIASYCICTSSFIVE